MSQTGDNKNKTAYDNENSDLLDLYRIMRDYIKHEDALINNRLTWLLTIQGLLFTAYGLAIRETARNSDLVSLILLLKILGIATSCLGFTGILAAGLAIKEIERKWQSIRPQDFIVNTLSEKLPDVTGGGNQVVHILGTLTPILIPLVFFVTWFYLLTLWRYYWLNYLLLGLFIFLVFIILDFPFKRLIKIKRR